MVVFVYFLGDRDPLGLCEWWCICFQVGSVKYLLVGDLVRLHSPGVAWGAFEEVYLDEHVVLEGVYDGAQLSQFSSFSLVGPHFPDLFLRGFSAGG